MSDHFVADEYLRKGSGFVLQRRTDMQNIKRQTYQRSVTFRDITFRSESTDRRIKGEQFIRLRCLLCRRWQRELLGESEVRVRMGIDTIETQCSQRFEDKSR